MGLQTIEAADHKLNSFWRAVVLSDDAPVTQHSPAPKGTRPHAKDKQTELGEVPRLPMNETIKLSIDTKLELVGAVESLTKSVTAKMGFDGEDSGWIELAVHEAVINAIKHGNHYSADKQVDVRFLIGQDAMTIYVRDHGNGFDPTRLPDPLDPENLLNPTGRGIFLMRTFMDEVEYSAHSEGGCVVRMRKYQRSSKKQIQRYGKEGTHR